VAFPRNCPRRAAIPENPIPENLLARFSIWFPRWSVFLCSERAGFGGMPIAKGARIAGAPFAWSVLLDEVDAFEGEVAERALMEALHFLAHRHDRQRVIERGPWSLALEHFLRLLVELDALGLIGG